MPDIQSITGLQASDDTGDVPKNAIVGNIVFVAAFGTALGLLGNEVQALQSWALATTPAFIGKILIQLGTVIGAYVGGRLIPTARE